MAWTIDDDGSRVGRRERKRRSTWLRIQGEALLLFEEHGFDRTTIEDIAAAADVSRTSVFRHFGTKEDILFAPEKELLKRLLRLMREDRRPGFSAVLLRFADHLDGMDHDLRQRASIIAQAPKLMDRFAQVRSRWELAVAQELARRTNADTPTLEHRIKASAALSALFTAFVLWAHEPTGALADTVRQAINAVPGTFPPDAATHPSRE